MPYFLFYFFILYIFFIFFLNGYMTQRNHYHLCLKETTTTSISFKVRQVKQQTFTGYLVSDIYFCLNHYILLRWSAYKVATLVKLLGFYVKQSYYDSFCNIAFSSNIIYAWCHLSFTSYSARICSGLCVLFHFLACNG